MSKTSNYQVTLEERGDFTRGLLEEGEGKKITPLEIQNFGHDLIRTSISNQFSPFADEEFDPYANLSQEELEIIDRQIDDLQEAK